MSPGIMSGVNCTRRMRTSRAAARDRTSSVLATPGTPSRSTWPRHSSATTRLVTAASWPTTPLWISVDSRCSWARVSWSTSGPVLVGAPGGSGAGRCPGWCRSSIDLLLETVQLVREADEVLVAGDGGGAEQAAQLFLRVVHVRAERRDQDVQGVFVTQPEPIG